LSSSLVESSSGTWPVTVAQRENSRPVFSRSWVRVQQLLPTGTGRQKMVKKVRKDLAMFRCNSPLSWSSNVFKLVILSVVFFGRILSIVMAKIKGYIKCTQTTTRALNHYLICLSKLYRDWALPKIDCDMDCDGPGGNVIKPLFFISQWPQNKLVCLSMDSFPCEPKCWGRGQEFDHGIANYKELHPGKLPPY